MAMIILTGASGSGKTTITKKIQSEFSNLVCFYFDSIGVPSYEKMVVDYGSGEGWQRAMTFEWMKRIQSSCTSEHSILFEGQVRISFIQEALQEFPIPNATIVLIDCDDITRYKRLSGDRSQPELANEQMMNWAEYLRKEAHSLEVQILNTSQQQITESANWIKSLLMSSN